MGIWGGHTLFVVTPSWCRQQHPVPRSHLSFSDAIHYPGEKTGKDKQANQTAGLLSQEEGSRMGTATACDAAEGGALRVPVTSTR